MELTPFANSGYKSLLQYIATFVGSICIYKFNECNPENVNYLSAD